MAVHGIIGKKVGMTQIFTPEGTVVPVTVVQAGPCLVIQKKTADKDGYEALQIGLVGVRPDRRANKPARGRSQPSRCIHSDSGDSGPSLVRLVFRFRCGSHPDDGTKRNAHWPDSAMGGSSPHDG